MTPPLHTLHALLAQQADARHSHRGMDLMRVNHALQTLLLDNAAALDFLYQRGYAPPKLEENRRQPKVYVKEIRSYMRRIAQGIPQGDIAEIMQVGKTRIGNIFSSEPRWDLSTVVNFLEAVRHLLGTHKDLVLDGYQLQDRLIQDAKEAVALFDQKDLAIAFNEHPCRLPFILDFDRKWSLERVRRFLQARVHFDSLNSRDTVYTGFVTQSKPSPSPLPLRSCS